MGRGAELKAETEGFEVENRTKIAIEGFLTNGSQKADKEVECVCTLLASTHPNLTVSSLEKKKKNHIITSNMHLYL
ncbi:hypothetical protein EVAR_52835_1 [Eumeta japonica]|uniref:Uncharacterized protein n=1 Tax=Eumeta variegata TaxID=151549 RepID=A0A4C1YF64_EUMVA|nr:hypothetical protein EVAR_52835_1 [Eumeta japonica]